MMTWIYAAIASAFVLSYWVFCRKNALKQQEKAVHMFEKFLSDEAISENEKTKMYFNYKLMRTWVALPLMLVISPFIIIFALASDKFKVEDASNVNSEEFDQFFGVLLQMYMAKNPLTSVVFMSVSGIVFAFSLVIGIMLNKVSKIPSYTLIASTIITKLIALKLRIKHAH